MMVDVVVFLIIAAMVTGAILKIRSDKKKGIKCAGCPHSKTCSSQSCSSVEKRPS